MNSSAPSMEWLEPWSAVEEGDTSCRHALEHELATEVCHGHPLCGIPARLIGRGDGDDCLFALLDGSARVALVHLVWQGPQQAPWPATVIYNDLETWCSECMRPEHQEWLQA